MIKPIRVACIVSCVAIFLGCFPTGASAFEWTRVSNFDALPENEGWAQRIGSGTASVQDGVLHLASPQGESIVWQNLYPGGLSALTYEMRFRVVSGTKNGCQLIYFGFGNPYTGMAINAEPGGLRNHWVTEGYSWGSNVIVNQDLADDFHTMWLAIDSTPSFSVWLDGSFVGNFVNGFRTKSPPTDGWISFGAGFQSNSEFLIDYARYSTDGAFPLPEPTNMLLLALGALSALRLRRCGL